MTKLIDPKNIDRIYIVCGKADLRKGIDGLATIIKEQFELNPFEPALFLFCGTRRDRFKAIYWEGDGFILLYKRLENGHFQWPRSVSEVRHLSAQQLSWLLEGMTIDRTIKQVKAGHFY